MPRASIAITPPAPSLGVALSWLAAAILALAVLVAPYRSHAAVAAKDADVLGRWTTDRNQPEMDYTVSAGPAGTIVVAVPGKAVGRAKGEMVALDRIGPTEFATPKGGKVRASFRVKDPRHAEFKMMVNRPDAFNLTDQLLERP